MPISPVAQGLSAVYSTAGQVLLPIAVDLVTVLALKILIPRSAPRLCWAIPILPVMAAVYGVYGIPVLNTSTIFMGCLYLAYKAGILFFIKRDEAWLPHPSLNVLSNKYFALMQKIKFPENHVNAEMVRRKWQEPEVIAMADALIKEAVQEMRSLYADLQQSAGQLTGQAQVKKMAEELTSGEGPSYFYRRFLCARTTTLLDIYRAVRGLQYCMTLEKYDSLRFSAEEVDAKPFFEEDKKQKEWRTDYNAIIDLFAPIMEELKKFPAERQSDVHRYCVWAVPDNEEQIAKPGDLRPDIFKLNPDTKP